MKTTKIMEIVSNKNELEVASEDSDDIFQGNIFDDDYWESDDEEDPDFQKANSIVQKIIQIQMRKNIKMLMKIGKR